MPEEVPGFATVGAALSGKHLPPIRDQRWCWRAFGSVPMLVTERHGAKVVLSAGHARRNGPPALMTRDPSSGFLEPITGFEPAMRVIAAAPMLLDALYSAEEFRDQLAREISAAVYAMEEKGDPAAAKAFLLKLSDWMHDGTLASYREELCEAIKAATGSRPDEEPRL